MQHSVRSARFGRSLVVVGLVGVVGLAGCGGSSGVSKSSFVDKVDLLCKSLDKDLAKLDQPSDLTGVSAFTDGAKKAYDTALADMKKLVVPKDSAVVADAKALVADFDGQTSLLTAIGTAADAGDQSAVDAKIGEFKKLADDNDGLATTLDAPHCALGALFDFQLTPPVTEPASTAPADTQPADTQPASDSNKTTTQLAEQMKPNGGYTFADTDPTIVKTFLTLLEINESTSSSSGQVSGVEVVDGNKTVVGRVFVFLPDSPLPSGVVEQIVPVVAGSATTSPATFGNLTGVTYQDPDGTTYFLGSNDPTAAGVLTWVISTDAANLEASITAFASALAG